MAAVPNSSQESRVAHVGRKIGQLASAASFLKGAVDTGRTLWAAGQVVSPYLARAAPLLL